MKKGTHQRQGCLPRSAREAGQRLSGGDGLPQSSLPRLATVASPQAHRTAVPPLPPSSSGPVQRMNTIITHYPLTLAYKNPTPVGPHILCPLATKKSQPRLCTSTGMCGTDWQASTRTVAPTDLRSRFHQCSRPALLFRDVSGEQGNQKSALGNFAHSGNIRYAPQRVAYVRCSNKLRPIVHHRS